MMAVFDRIAFGQVTRRALMLNGGGYRLLAQQIGVTINDLSRVVNGHPVAIEKVLAIADWIGVDPRDFYHNPTARLNKINVFQSASRETQEGK